MYCSGCGQVLAPGQPFCPHCGRPATGAAPAAAPAVFLYTRVHRHIQTLSILWIAYGLWTLLQWLLALSFFSGVFGGYFGRMNYGPFGEFPFSHMPWFVPLITALVIARTILSVFTGVALVSRAHWARIFAIVIAFLTLIKPITGTILAIYTLWVLLPALSGDEYAQISAERQR